MCESGRPYKRLFRFNVSVLCNCLYRLLKQDTT